MKCVRLLSTAACALGVCVSLPAVEFCVTNSSELQNALTTAAGNGQENTIRIAAGSYDAPSGGFVYNAVAGGNDNHLTIIGGWSPLTQVPCVLILDQNPFQTVLDGNDNDRVMEVRLPENSNLTVRLLSVMNGSVSPGRGGGLWVSANPGGSYEGQIRIESNAFVNNEANYGGGLSVSVSEAIGNTRLWVTNNVFVGNHAEAGGAGAGEMVVNGGDGGTSGAGLFVVNNTIISNTTGDLVWSPGGLWVAGSVPSRIVANNNLWENEGGGGDFRVVASSSATLGLFSNNIGHITGASPTSEGGNISVEPQYEPCPLCFEWVPVLNSPLVDAGMHPRFDAGWTLSEYDLNGRPRVDSAGGRVDIGAYENHDRFFSDRFEQ